MAKNCVSFLLVVCVSFAVGQDNSGSGSNGNSDNIVYLCSLDDWDCIKNYFVNTYQCTPVSHKDGDPIMRDMQVAHLPKFNATVLTVDDTITFYGSKMETFFVNEETGVLVMTVNIESINLQSPRAIVAIHQRDDEARIVEDIINVTYSAALTAIIPRSGVKGASVSSYNTNAYPPFTVGPKISQSSDPVVQQFFTSLVSDIPTAVQELLLTKGPYFFYIYLQEYICNFGVEYIGEIIN